MRKFVEPTARNLLRRPLVMGVPFSGLLGLTFVSLFAFVLGGGRGTANAIALGIGFVGYVVLRVFNRFSKTGWEERPLFALERLARRQAPTGTVSFLDSQVAVLSPDTLREDDLLVAKDGLLPDLLKMGAGLGRAIALQIGDRGALLQEVRTAGIFDLRRPSAHCPPGVQHVYSLHQLPVATDPLWLFGVLSHLPAETWALVRFQGLNRSEIKRRIEISRRSNASGGRAVSDVDAEVSFEEASLVLQGLSRGDDAVLEASLVIASRHELDLDPELFCREKCPDLALSSVLGIRKRLHRSHAVRAVTACDLVPNICDPEEIGSAILKTLRCQPLYFSPQDPRLEALHWLVVGASGSGKSFFTGLVLKRMLDEGTPMSVLFVDHGRSFRRLVLSAQAPYLEPRNLAAVKMLSGPLLAHWGNAGALCGIELSDLDFSEKKAAVHALLSGIEAFLRQRQTTHPAYLVLDECWNFLRDEPVLVQRAFREFRKLNGAVIAITQSLHDFLGDESGQSIFQNAPIRILLRQGEDMGRYQGILGLNPIELRLVSRLRQQKGLFSECLIKTPFLSRLGRLYPTDVEHALLRTDNLRAELIAEAKAKIQEAACLG